MNPLSSMFTCVAVVLFMGLCCPAPVNESLKAEIRFTGIVTHHDIEGVYFVDVKEVIEGPPPLWDNVMVNYFQGVEDDIQPDDIVDIFGILYWNEDEQSRGCSVSLEKPEHFIKRIKVKGPPVLEVYWNTLDSYTIGDPFEFAVTVCNAGGDASVDVVLWMGDNPIESEPWHILSRRCITWGWIGGSGPTLTEEYVQDGLIQYRIKGVAQNEYGTDTYDETRYFPVNTASQPGSVTIFTREKCGRPLEAVVFLNGEYKGQTDAEGKLWLSGLSSMYEVVAVGIEEYTEGMTTIEGDVNKAIISCLFLEKKRNTPWLAVTPTTLQFEPLTNEEVKTLTIEIKNSGRGFLSYYAASDRSWITVHPEYGLVEEFPSTLQVVIDASHMEAGSYIGEIVIHSNGGVKYVEVFLSVVHSTDMIIFLGIFLVSTTLVGLAAFSLSKRKIKKKIKGKITCKPVKVHHLLLGAGSCFLVILFIVLNQSLSGLPALHIQSLLFLITLLFFLLSVIVYLMNKSVSDRVMSVFMWKLFFAMAVIYGVGSMILNQFALGLITDAYLTFFSLSIGYFVIFLFVLSCAFAMVMNLVIARGFGRILLVSQNLLNFWGYLQVSKPKKISSIKTQEPSPQVMQAFFYRVFELLFASFWIVLVYSIEIGHQVNMMLIPIFVQVIPLAFSDLLEFLIPLIWFVVPLFILFPLFIAEDLPIGVDGNLVSPRTFHKLLSALTILTLVIRAVTWGLIDFVAFLWALWLLLPIQSGLAWGYMNTREWANCVAKKRADQVV